MLACTCVFFVTRKKCLTRGHLVVLGGGAVLQDVLHLQELVSAVPPDDGEAKAVGALPQGRVVQLPVQLAGVRREGGRHALTWDRGAEGVRGMSYVVLLCFSMLGLLLWWEGVCGGRVRWCVFV